VNLSGLHKLVCHYAMFVMCHLVYVTDHADIRRRLLTMATGESALTEVKLLLLFLAVYLMVRRYL